MMVAYSFKAQFVEPIRTRRKQQTIRADRGGRSRHARPGEALQLYTAMRTKHCELIGRAICSAVAPILIRFDQPRLYVYPAIVARTDRQLDHFAQLDGFTCWRSMCEFWKAAHGTLADFRGTIIYWQDFLEP